jgi:hypothetical protein
MLPSSFRRFEDDSDDEDSPPVRHSPKPSLFERLQSSDTLASRPPKPKPFHMSEPFQQPGGLWCFWLTADDPILRFVGYLSCVMNIGNAAPFPRSSRGHVMFGINPRYDHEEAWMWIYRMLESETQPVELGSLWTEALEDEEENDLQA